jgi:hypothetical protein
MPRQTFYWNPLREEWTAYKPLPASNTAVHVIRDALPGGLDGMVSHADGERYTSKRAYERGVRRAGCEVVGNERTDHIKPPPLHAPREVGMDIKRAYEQHRNRSR